MLRFHFDQCYVRATPRSSQSPNDRMWQRASRFLERRSSTMRSVLIREPPGLVSSICGAHRSRLRRRRRHEILVYESVGEDFTNGGSREMLVRRCFRPKLSTGATAGPATGADSGYKSPGLAAFPLGKVATVDPDNVPAYVGACVTGEEYNHRGDFVRRPRAAHGVGGD